VPPAVEALKPPESGGCEHDLVAVDATDADVRASTPLAPAHDSPSPAPSRSARMRLARPSRVVSIASRADEAHCPLCPRRSNANAHAPAASRNALSAASLAIRAS